MCIAHSDVLWGMDYGVRKRGEAKEKKMETYDSSPDLLDLPSNSQESPKTQDGEPRDQELEIR